MSYILTFLTASNSNAAARYAAGLATELGLPLRVLYPFMVPVSFGEMPMPLLPIEEVRTGAAEGLRKTIELLKGLYPSLSITGDAVYGALTDVAIDTAEQTPPLLTIVGNSESGEGEKWLGDDNTEMLREGSGLMLAVPHSAAYKRPVHICLACDARDIRQGLPLASLLGVSKTLGARITVLHVRSAGTDDSVIYEGSALSQALNGIAAYVEIDSAGNVDEAIVAFADGHQIDWLALAPHHHGFWEGLFHKSHTGNVLHLAHVPVLALRN